MLDEHPYFRYWGKASPANEGMDLFHLLPYHSLDVSACGRALLDLPQFSLNSLAEELDWPPAIVEHLFVFFLALHDLGKFARAFQGLVPDLSPDLVPADEDKPYTQRHDTLGWMFWREEAVDSMQADFLPDCASEFWSVWVRSVVGHHGKPPQEHEGGGLIAQDAGEFFLRADRRAARSFMADIAELLLPTDIPLPGREHLVALKRHTWRLAGLSVLADWLGSNQAFFPYRAEPGSLAKYWTYAQAQATQAISMAGLHGQGVREWPAPLALFDYLREPTPLQQYAATVELESGPQLFLLEDVTGAGKTEAALILTQRLMQAGRAQGLYFALPSMATANQMYQRVGSVYQRLYASDAQPSLILAHGARQLVDGFRQSILQEQPSDHTYQPGEGSASAQCNAWLADNRKKALLAEVGVGTLDQALLAVLPARHQSLRLLGLAGKVLLVDEVHAYDAYMMSLLETLLTAHARQGGSVILLSATLPLLARDRLLAAYRFGLNTDDGEGLADARYPLAVRAGRELVAHACATRPQVRRKVQVQALHEEAAVLEMITEQARAGRCVAWIRNTVADARRAHRLLSEHLPPEHLQLFHSRYAMGDRLDIEAEVLARFGKHSTGAERAGRVLVGTQVLEQSLDFDVDLMVSDLAPIDLLIQRAGRLQRHARQADGNPAADGVEQRPAPVLCLLTPEPVADAKADWYAAMFPKGCFVYPDAGALWRGARALLHAGCIITPGEAGQPGAVRELVEAVYGEQAEEVPDALSKASQDQAGKDMAMKSQAHFNALKLNKGYCIDSSDRWYEEHQVPTRLGDETLTLYLALWRDGELQPLRNEGAYCWEQSAVRIHTGYAQSLAPDWQQRFDSALQQLRSGWRLLEEPAFILPLLEKEGALLAKVQDERGRVLEMRYDQRSGLSW
ncbi:CRISPR-associated helicase Cas3' [Halopseudomonas xiamenensis]|uniref:CRISPR-associated helicase Cas3' n=1 Tax=Halopseudomonas xiamenensis TaxID=157792 RepID=UPI001626E050|nr:CRISPR-associated helicase Cas3' [Halopseudomonas xiamenensis]